MISYLSIDNGQPTLQVDLRIQVGEMAEASGIKVNWGIGTGPVCDDDVFITKKALDLLWRLLFILGMREDGETRFVRGGDMGGSAISGIRSSDQLFESLETVEIHWKLLE